LEALRHDYSAALHDDLKALSAYQLVSSVGLGRYQSTVGFPQEGAVWLSFGDYDPTFVAAVDNDIRTLQSQGTTG
jgi:hypothetical protein